MKVSIEPMTIDHYDEVIALWKVSENVGLSSADERESIKSYLARNPGLSFVAKENGHIIAQHSAGMMEDVGTFSIWPLKSLIGKEA